MISRRSHPKGSTLLAVFWLIAILTFAVFAGIGFQVNRVDTQTTRLQAFRAEQLIERGLALATHPGVEKNDPLLRFEPTGLESLEVTLNSEGARFHLNALLQSGDRQLLESIFALWGLDPAQTGTLIDHLQDWIDSDDLPRLNGAEAEAYEEAGYTGRPFDRPFQSLNEVSLVMGMDAVEELVPNWRDWFTLWSSSGKLDVNSAPADLLQIACACPPQDALAIVEARSGADGIPLTEDDLVFTTVQEALSYLSSTDLDLNQIAARLTVSEPVKRVAIVARVGDYGARRDVVLSKDGNIQLFYWRDSILP